MAYGIVSIPEDAREDTEQLGSKPKFWVALGGERWLFKEARENTGEDWAEKVAAELASALGIPAARVELAEYCGRRGCISRSFMSADAGEALVHGNEILAFVIMRTGACSSTSTAAQTGWGSEWHPATTMRPHWVASCSTQGGPSFCETTDLSATWQKGGAGSFTLPPTLEVRTLCGWSRPPPSNILTTSVRRCCLYED